MRLSIGMFLSDASVALLSHVSCQRDAGNVSGGNMRGTYRYTRRRSVMPPWHTGHTVTWAAQTPQNTCLQRVSKTTSHPKL